MAKVDLSSGTIKLEGGDIATVALMAGLLAATTEPALYDEDTPAYAATEATTIYREVVKAVFKSNGEPTDREATAILLEVWDGLPEIDTDKVLGEDLTTRLVAYLDKQGVLDTDS